jgi:hypothetical protein
MYRSNALVTCFGLRVVLPLALLIMLLPSLAVAQGQYNFIVPPTFTGTGNLFAADFNGDGKLDLLDSYGNLQLGNGDGTFIPGPSVAGTPLAVADFNGDGKPDVLEQGTGTLLVLLGNGDGTFQAPISTDSGADLTGIAAGDLNGDGKADVVGVFNGSMLVYLSKGDGTFAAGVPYSLGTTSTPSAPMTLADFNGDKKTDAAVSIDSSNGPGQEIVFLGNGDGTFRTALTSPGVDGPESVVAGDFNGDGKLDLAISFSGTPTSVPPGVSVLLGNGDGTFQAPTIVIPTDGSLAVADLNGDGKLDLVLQNFPANWISWAEIYLGNGNGTFSNTRSYFLNVEAFPSGVPVIADFNLDGKPDVAAGDYLLLGNGDGTFQGVAGLPLPFTYCGCGGFGAALAVVGDFDKNAAPYIAAINGSNLDILSNDGAATLALAHTYTLQQPTPGIATGDLNGDGNLDLVVASGNTGYSVLLGNGDGSFQPPAFYQLANAGYSIVLADFNRDGKLDLAIPAGNQTVAVLLGNGNGTFGAPIYTFDGGGGSLVSADFNGDGKPDLAAVGASGITILLGNGDGTFQTATFISTVTGESLLFTADLNGDGKPDLITGGGYVFLGNGDGTFTALAYKGISVYALADINGDGKPDVIGPQTSTQCCGFYLGNGDGTFGPYISVLNIESGKIFQFVPGFVLAADMTAAGKQDVIMGGGSVPGVFVLINITNPVTVNLVPTSLFFLPPQPVGVSSPPLIARLTNTGSLNLTISSIQITGANGGDFSMTTGCAPTFPPNDSCKFNVTFTPTAYGLRSAFLTITDNAPNSPQSVRLSGIGAGAAVALKPTSLTFPSETIGVTSPAQPVMLTVVGGNAALSISSIATQGDFAQTNNCPSSIPVGSGCIINVTFTPTAAGALNGSLVLTDNAGTPQQVSLTGTGVSGTLGLAVAPGGSSSATVAAGAMATYKLTIGGAGFSGMASLTCTGAPQGANCSFPSGATMNVSATTATPFNVTVTTTSRSMAAFSPRSTSSHSWLWAMVLMGVFILPNAKPRKRLAWRIVRLSPLVLMLLLSGCGSGNGGTSTNMNGTPAGTYALRVNATAGSVNPSVALTLTVQ